MKKIKVLYGLLFVAALFVVVIIIAAIKAPPPKANNKTAEASNCLPSLLSGQALVNGLGPDVQIPLFPGAKRLTFTDATAVQYVAKAYDSDIKSFYDDRLTSLCWQIKAQSRDQIVYKNDGRELKLSLLPNPAGKTVIDYVITTTEGVLGTVRIATAACTADQYYCNGGCVAMSTSCPAPTDASACTGGTVYCPSSGGGSGWCQFGSCPSSTSTTTSTWPTDQATCSSRGYFWCNNACQTMACTTTTSSSPSCSGSYQQSGSTYPSCNYSTCPNGCTWDSSGCPNGCYTSSTSGTVENSTPLCNDGIDNDHDGLTDAADSSCAGYASGSTATSTSCPSGQYMCNGACISNTTSCGSSTTSAWPTDQATCTSQAKFWCTPSSGGSGWCQSTACGTTSSACSSGYYWCSSTNSCISSSQSCGTGTTSGSTSTYAGDANSCPSFSYSRWDSTNRRYCQLNNEVRCDYNYPSYLTNGGNYTAANCPAGSSTGSGGYTSGCSSTQFLCNGACVAMGTSCSSQAWPTDQASCTSQAKFWCTSSTGGGSTSNGWCQSTACSTNYSTVSCQSGQWQCNGACISTSTQCNGYYHDGTSVTAPSGTTCAGGYKWCASSQSCVNAVQPCYPSTTQTQQTQTQQTQPTTQQQQQQQAQPQNFDQARTNQQPNNQQFNQDNRQFNQGPSEEDMKRMKEEQFRQMKRGMDQFSRGVTQMKRFVDRAKARLEKQGVGIPLELINAMAKAPELLAKLKAAKTIEEFEDLMGDMQDIGMIMQEWGPKMGELERLGQMLSQASRDLRNMSTNFKRVKRAAARRPELADALKEVEAMLGVMGKKAADAKALAKADPEGALELVEDFYGNSEEYWNTVAIIDMVANVTRGLSQANSEIRRAETRIRNLERSKQADKEVIAALKEMITSIKESLPELRAVLARRPVDYEEIKFAAESFWEQIQEFENLLSEQGQGFYAPTVKSGQGINIDIPEGFLGSSNNSGPQGPGPLEGGGPGGFGPGGF